MTSKIVNGKENVHTSDSKVEIFGFDSMGPNQPNAKIQPPLDPQRNNFNSNAENLLTPMEDKQNNSLFMQTESDKSRIQHFHSQAITAPKREVRDPKIPQNWKKNSAIPMSKLMEQLDETLQLSVLGDSQLYKNVQNYIEPKTKNSNGSM